MKSVGFATRGDGKMNTHKCNKCGHEDKLGSWIGIALTCPECGDYLNPLTTQTEPVAKLQCSDGLCPQTRYRLQYGGHELAFSAPMAETREQLAEVLEEAVGMLKAPEDTGEFGFF
jgi:hypothetical protein